MTQRRRDKPVVREPDPSDIWAEKAAAKAAEAMAAWMKGSLALARPMSSLTKGEMNLMAVSAIHSWIVSSSERMIETADPDEREKLKQFLMG